MNDFQSLKKVLHSLRCLTDREMMADKVINISREVNILEAQKFWMMGESPGVMSIKPIPNINTSIDIKIPFEHVTLSTVPVHGRDLVTGVSDDDHIPARFIADFRTRDMLGSRSCWSELSHARSTLMMNVHGGGFIAQTPVSHIGEKYFKLLKMFSFNNTSQQLLASQATA